MEINGDGALLMSTTSSKPSLGEDDARGTLTTTTAKKKKEEGSEEEVSEEMSGDDEDGEDECAKKGSGSCAGGSPLLTLEDESTKTPGLFLAGPSVMHGKLSFCFIYKYRQRFGIVADAIARGLGYDTEDAVEKSRKMDMFMDDFPCCQAACGESC